MNLGDMVQQLRVPLVDRASWLGETEPQGFKPFSGTARRLGGDLCDSFRVPDSWLRAAEPGIIEPAVIEPEVVELLSDEEPEEPASTTAPSLTAISFTTVMSHKSPLPTRKRRRG